MARIGADVGGTFTDVVIELDHGELVSTKVLTTHEAPEEGILAGIAKVLEQAGVRYEDLDQIIHGTTLATNALIERRGAKTALVTTEGFRDVIEMRTESRFEQYDLNIVLPKPLIERKDRLTVAGRLDAQGNVLAPFDEAQAAAVIETIRDRGYEAVAVGFIHSYVNAAHEQRFAEMLTEAIAGVAVSLSSQVSPQIREYERFNTVCANAYVQPLIASYLHRLEAGLARLGATCPLYLIHSGGGLISVETAARFPVRLVESGPAGGAIFAANLAHTYGIEKALSYDMGGTTAKIALIENFTPQSATTFEVDRTARFKKGSGMPISIPVIEMIEIGAGGGSIASLDSLNQVRIGPESAGSEPGPASYGLGGTDATVTDANVVLAKLAPENFGASDITLDPGLGESALTEHIASPLGLEVSQAAVAVCEVVDENMSNAARVHAVENGKDLGGYAMIAFGGGAPLHAARLMDKLGLDELIVPPGAGVGSAIGFLRAPFAYEAMRSHYVDLAKIDVTEVNAMLAELTEEAHAFVSAGTDVNADQTTSASAADGTDITVEKTVAMRYAGQGWEIPVRLGAEVLGSAEFGADAAQRLETAFTQAYIQFFGRNIEDLAIEAVSWSVRVATVAQRPDPVELNSTPTRVLQAQKQREMIHSATGETVSAAVFARSDLQPGDGITGPAIITETQTTTIVSPDQTLTTQSDGTLLITR